MKPDADVQSRLNRLSQQVPSYAGYMLPQDRGKSDRLLREAVAAKLQSIQQQIERGLADQVDQGILNSLPLGERLKARIETFRQTVVAESLNKEAFENADSSDSSSPLTSTLLKLDHQLIEAVNSLEASVGQLVAHARIHPESLLGVQHQIDELQKTFGDRSEICVS